MKGRLISEDVQRTFAVILSTDDEAVACLTAFAKEHRLSASQFTGLGAFRDCVLGYFDWQKKRLHAHPDRGAGRGASAGRRHRTERRRAEAAYARGGEQGGHLLEAHVRPTLEVIITESPTHLHRRSDPETGLALIRL
jgi:uncharacterized protein